MTLDDRIAREGTISVGRHALATAALHFGRCEFDACASTLHEAMECVRRLMDMPVEAPCESSA